MNAAESQSTADGAQSTDAPPTQAEHAQTTADAAGTPGKAGSEASGAATESSPSKWGDDSDALSLGGIDPEDETARVEVLQVDPNTPYQSASTFEEIGLSKELIKGIYQLKFNKPSKIQATSLPMILSSDGEYKNLIAQGHNGSGKTACFVLGMLSRVDATKAATQALCVVPTRELARQIEEVVLALGKYTSVTTKLAVKDTEEERVAARQKRVAGALTEMIVVGTPGKVMELIKKRRLDTSGMKIFVLDEADEMVDTQGMGDQTIRIKRALPRNVQVLLFSATYKEEVRALASKLAPNANQIRIKRETLSLDKVQQYYIDTGSSEERFEVLAEIYGLLSLGQSIIFVRTRQQAGELTRRLRDGGHTVSVLYGGDMTPEERDRVIDEFRSGTTRVLVTTNVLSRGVDVQAVTAVINYDLPTDRGGATADAETYLHRIGRTGRFGRQGIAVNFVFDDKSKAIVQQLEKYYDKRIERVDDVEELAVRIGNIRNL